MKNNYLLFLIIFISTVGNAKSSNYKCTVNEIYNGQRQQELTLNIHSSSEQAEVITQSKLKAKVWTYVGLLGISIEKERTVLTQSRTPELNFTSNELWYTTNEQNDKLWVSCIVE